MSIIGRKRYLGDSVYISAAIYTDGVFEVVLTTEDGIRTTNTIVLEPSTLNAFLDYVKELTVKS